MENIESHIIYQDEAIIVVNKPVNLPVHKNDHMAFDAPYLTKVIGDFTGKWIYNVHRLDSKTSGIIVLALSSEYAKVLTKQFENRTVTKVYTAIAKGCTPEEGVFDNAVLIKKKGKRAKAKTQYKTIKTIHTDLIGKNDEEISLSLVEVTPETGRWHQIRQHFANNRYDLLGDNMHGDFTLNRVITAKTEITRLYLHASELTFTHPVTEERMTFKAELPEDFNTVMALSK